MNRLQKFHSYVDHPMHGKIYKKMGAENRAVCEQFIKENDHLSFGEFDLKVNRWGLNTDFSKSKHYSSMWALVSQCNLVTKESK